MLSNTFVKGVSFHPFDTRQRLLPSISEKTVATFGPQVLLSKRAHTQNPKINRCFSVQKLRRAPLSFQKICVLRSSCVCLLVFSCFIIASDQFRFRVIAREDVDGQVSFKNVLLV